MAVNVSKIPNRKDFDAVREAILQVDNNVTQIIAGEGLVSDVNGITGSVNITGTAVSTNVGTNTITISANEANDGVLTLTASTGISISTPNTFSADQATNREITITNSAPDQVVTLSDSTNIDFTGTYPNFSGDLKSNVTISGTLTAGNLTTGGTLTATDVVADTGDFSTSLTINGDSVVTELIAKGAITFEGVQQISANTDTWGAEAQTWETSTLPDDTTSYTILHQDTSSQADVYNTGGNVIQSIGLDTYGHVGSIGSTDLDQRYLAFKTISVGGTALEADAYNDTLSITSSDGITLTTGNDSFNIAGDDKFKQVSVAGTTLSPDSFDDTLSITSSNGVTLTTGDDSFEIVGDDKFKFVRTEDDNKTLSPSAFNSTLTLNGSPSISVSSDTDTNTVTFALSLNDISFDNDGNRIARGLLYYQQAGVPVEGDKPSGTFDFTTYTITLTGANANLWSENPPQSGSPSVTLYVLKYESVDTGAGTESARSVDFGAIQSATGFEAPVTFSDFTSGGRTIIDGGIIRTGAISSNGFVVGTTPTDFSTEGTKWFLEGNAQNAAGDIISEQFKITSGSATFAGTIQAVASINGTPAGDVVTDAADGAAAKATTDDLESVVTISNTKIYQGTGTFNNSNTGFYLDNVGQFSLKDKLSFDGTTLNVVGQITVQSGSSISSDTTIDGTAASTINSNASNGNDAFGVTTNLEDVVTITSTKIYQGTGTFNNADTGFYLDDAGQFSLKDKLSFNGTTLTVDGNGTFTGTLNAGDVTITEDEITIKNTNTGTAPSSKIKFTNSTDTLVGVIEAGRLVSGTVVDGINIQSETDDLFISSDKNITLRGTAAGTMADNVDIQSSYTFFGGKMHYVIDDTSIGNGAFQNVCQLNSSVDSPSSKALTIKVEVSYEDNGTPAYYEGIFVAYYTYSVGSTWTLNSISRVREEGNTDLRASVFSSTIIRLSNATGDLGGTEYACNVTVQGYANEIGDFLEILDVAAMTYVL